MPDPLPESPDGDAASHQPFSVSASGATAVAVAEPPPIPMITSDIPSNTEQQVQSPAITSPTVRTSATNGIANPITAASQSLPASMLPVRKASAPVLPVQPTAPPPSQHVNYQTYTAQQQSYVGRPDPRVAKPVIVDPPGTPISNGAIQSSGFPSPSLGPAELNPKFNEDISRLTFAVKQSVPEAVRRVIRDNWEKCVLGSDFHQAFVMNATVHRANPTITKRAIRDFGTQLVSVGKREILELFHAKDIDAVADIILDKASNVFLDHALERRLSTIEAKPLINALARAERLGYERGDIVEEQGVGNGEKVIPHNPQQLPPPQQIPMQTPMQPHPPSGLLFPQPGQWQCDQCFRIFTAESAHEHHMRKTVCKRAAPTPEGFKFCCPHCGQGFTTPVGLKYHIDNKVCGDFRNHPASLFTPSPHPAPVPPMANFSTSPNVHQAPLPFPPSSAIVPSAPNTPNNLVVKGVNPYAHLTPEQTAAMNDELQQAEMQYADKFRAVEAIADPGERRAKLDSLRNSFGTKQSMIRKKYGVRLRERRTRAEIQAERERMGRPPEGQLGRPPKPTPAAASGVTTSWRVVNTPQLTDSAARDAKRRRLDGGGAAPGFSSPFPNGASPLAHKPPNRTAARDSSTPGRTGTPASQIYEQSGALVEVYLPLGNAAAPGSGDEAEEAINQQLVMEHTNRQGQTPGPKENDRGGSVDKPISFDDSDDDDDDDDDSSDGDDEDIPASLPPSVLASLGASRRP